MAQIIKHRRGSLESLSAVTASLQKGELLIASGSSNLSVTNGASLVFSVPESGQVQAVNRFLIGNSAPATFAGSTYNGMVNGVPFYDSGSGTLYLLGSDGNTAINLTGNIQPFSASVASSINALSASIGSGAIGTSVSALNTFSGSTLVSLAALNDFTSSQLDKDSALESYTASVDGRLDSLETFSGSQLTQNSALATVTGSLISSASVAKSTNDEQDGRLTSLEAKSASVDVSVSSLNSWSASAKTNLTALNATGSDHEGRISDLETFQSDIETAISVDGQNVTINGNFTVSGTQTIVDSTTVQIGDNIIELNGSGAANGGLWVKDVTNPNTETGSIVWDSTNDYWKAGVKGSESKVLLAGGDSVVSGSSQITISDTTGFESFSSSLASIDAELFATASDHEDRLETIETSLGGGGGIGTRVSALESSSAQLNSFSSSTLVSLSNLESTTASLNTSVSNINAFTASQLTQNSALATVTGSLISSASAASVSVSNLNSYTSSADSRFSEIAVVSGSLIASASAASVSISNLNSFSASQLTQNSTLASYTASVESRLTEIGVVSGSLIVSASAAKTKNDAQDARLTSLESTSASVNVSISNINSFTSSADDRISTLEGTGTIQGVGTSDEVTFAKVTTSGDVVIGGDLVVQGNTVTLNTSQLVVEDKLITLASGSTSNATADGAGFEVAGTSAKFTYNGTTNEFSSSVAIAANVTGSINIPGAGTSKRLAFRNAVGNIDFVAAPSNVGDIAQWDGNDFVMSNVIDGGSF